MRFTATSIRCELFPMPGFEPIGLNRYLQDRALSIKKLLSPAQEQLLLFPIYEAMVAEAEMEPEAQRTSLDDLKLLCLPPPTKPRYSKANNDDTLSLLTKMLLKIGKEPKTLDRSANLIEFVALFGLPLLSLDMPPICKNSTFYSTFQAHQSLQKAINKKVSSPPILSLQNVVWLVRDYYLLYSLCILWRNGNLNSQEAADLWEEFYGSVPGLPSKQLREELWRRLEFHFQRTYGFPQKSDDRKYPWLTFPVITARDPLCFAYLELACMLSNESHQLVCPVCKEFFTPKRSNSLCCSSKCSTTKRQRDFIQRRQELTE